MTWRESLLVNFDVSFRFKLVIKKIARNISRSRACWARARHAPVGVRQSSLRFADVAN